MSRAVSGRTVPYITVRAGEVPAPARYLRVISSGDHIFFGRAPRLRLGYWDEAEDDRGPRGELWGRCSQSIGVDGLPAGEPAWGLVHPARQRECMLLQRCQICAGPTRRPEGRIYLESARDGRPGPGRPWRTAQPPLCPPCARKSVRACDELREKGYYALLVRQAPLYGVIGTSYDAGLQVVRADDIPVPYGSPDLDMFLASQLVRECKDYDVIDLADLARAA